MRLPLLALALLAALGGCKPPAETPEGGKTGGTTKPATTKLGIKDTKPGTGPAAATGDDVWVLYTGKLTNGTVFDSTSKRGDTPFKVSLGAGTVIKGWDQGLVGVKVGGQRTLEIPYTLAYGEAGNPPTIPAKSDLVFDVEAVALVKKGEEDVVSSKDLAPGAGRAVKAGDKITIKYVIEDLGRKKKGENRATFVVGKRQASAGVDAGVIDMKVGGKRELFLPPAVALGPSGMRYGISFSDPIFITVTLEKIG